MRRVFVWLLLLAALGVVAYVISVPHSTRPCLQTPRHPCAGQSSETHQ